MSKKNFIEACREQTNYTVATSKGELELFCEIMGLQKSKVNYFIGDDPHGEVDIMEGYRYFNMTDIHVVISEYEHWMEIYKTNEELRKAVDAWYYYCQEWHEQHHTAEWNRISQEKEEIPDESMLNLPVLDMDSKMAHKHYSKPVLIVDEMCLHSPTCCSRIPASVAMYDYDAKDWWLDELGVYYHDTFHVEITHWKYLDWPDDTHCPNLRSWLAGCPVDGLRDATLGWQTQRERDLQAAHQRVEECKQALEDAIKGEVKLNKF